MSGINNQTISQQILAAAAARTIIEELERKGGCKKAIAHIKATFWKPELLDELDTWSRQYVTRGHIFTDDPSPCAEDIVSRLPGSGRVFEIGSGTGRDAKFYVDNGLIYEGIDNARFAVFETGEMLERSKQYKGDSKASFANIITTSVTPNFFDAASAHRVLHLPDPDDLPAILNRISMSLKSEGRIAFTFRRPDDFDPDNMIRIDDYTAERKDLNGDLTNFYDEERANLLLSKHFTDLVYTEIEEPDACDKFNKDGSPKMTQLLLATGRKKTDKEREQTNGNNGHTSQPQTEMS
tara:strand:- start:3675 stop:4559 length:885 start_codon:yes stop_codon:yes gene_type:complete